MIPFSQIGIAFVIFTIIFFLSKRPLRLEDKVASVFMFFLGLPMFIKLVIIGAIPVPVPYIVLSIMSYPFTYGPFLFLYTKFAIDPKPVFKKKYLLHFLPFIFFAVLPLIFPQMQIMPPEKNMESRSHIENRFNNLMKPPVISEIPDFPRPAPGSMPPEIRLNAPFPKPDVNANTAVLFPIILIVVSFIVYTVMIFRLLHKHKKNISGYFSYDSIRLNLKWLQWITLCFVISYSFVFITAQISPEIYMHPMLDRRITPDIALTFFIFAFCFFAVKQPVIFKDSDNIEMNDHNSGEKIKKYGKSGLKEAEAENYLNTLEEYMTTEKPYLDGDLTIADISAKLGIPKHYLTQVINEKLNKNFFMYVNEYRVKEARQMLGDDTYRDYTILRIAYDAGFNSKSAFNTIFKKLTGFTPTEYRKDAASGV